EEIGGPPRQVPIVIRPEELTMVDLALASHHHGDHCDPRTLVPLLQTAKADVWTSYTGREMLLAEGVDNERIVWPPVNLRRLINDDLAITAIPSAHYTFEADHLGNPAFLGFLVEMNGVRFYHPGDTIVYEGLAEHLRRFAPDLAFLPINGRDWYREQDGLV